MFYLYAKEEIMMNHRGFTLIELMVTVSIVGLLAILGIPAYQDYSIRARVSEGLSLGFGAQLAVNEFTYINNQLPLTQVDTQYVSPAATMNVASIVIGAAGVITITYTPNAGNGSIVLQPTLSSSVLLWDCTGGTLAPKYRPTRCR